MKPEYYIYQLGESAVTIAFNNVIDNAVNNQVLALYTHLQAQQIAGVVDVIPSYNTVTLVFDTVTFKQKILNVEQQLAIVEAAIITCNWQLHQQQNVVEIPVCYDVSLGLDLEELAAVKNLTVKEVITLHKATIYRVYAIGFLPGFTYMGKVNEQIATPRKATPRVNVIAGSVGIAGEQTGIYPINSPGGWNIIGQTPLQLFDANRKEPVLLKIGDGVKFVPIGLNEFYTYKNTVATNVISQPSKQAGIVILKAGIADSVQDLGRYGYQHLGINPTGVMDAVAATIANYLVGNAANEAVIEIHFPASVFQFQSDAIFALSGADFTAYIDDRIIPINTPIIISKEVVIRFTKLKTGARCYMAIAGGCSIDVWLNSCSTNVKANAGGYCGRLLQKNDVLPFKKPQDFSTFLATNNCIVLPWQVDVASVYTFENNIDVLVGNEYQFLCGASKEILFDTTFTITNKSDRMGYRLHGLPLQLQQPLSLISTAVTKGTIQLLPDGELIVLMADHQTIGGYPRIGHVVQTDVHKLSQIQAHQSIKFQLTTCELAIKKLYSQRQYLLQIQNACIFKLKEYLGK